MGKITVAYLYESDWRKRVNERGENYWYEYIKEINDQLGLRAEMVSKNAIEKGNALNRIKVLLIGDLKDKEISSLMSKNLKQWVFSGGILIGMGVEGLDSLFGNEYIGVINQRNWYERTGHFSFESHLLTQNIHSSLVPLQKLLIFSSIREIIPKVSTKLATLYDEKKEITKFAAITKYNYGRGKTFYFAFNLPQTIWVLHQGRPVSYDIDGDGYCKTSDLSVIGKNSGKVLYADEILFLLQNMIGQIKQPFIHQLPPFGQTIPDALLYWGGDDEFLEGTQIRASNWMKSKNLPYHINILFRDGSCNLKREEFEVIKNNGHEVSLHYNYLDGNTPPYLFTKNDVRKQIEDFKRTFNYTPVCTVNHYTLWNGWAEPAKWMSNTGQLADNSFYYKSYDRPLFAYGTAYPFFFYTDWQEENTRINLIEEVISAYELGYFTNKTKNDLRINTREIHEVIDTAIKYHLCINMFYHSYRISGWPAARKSIEEILRYIKKKNYSILHMGNDELARWWKARSECQINEIVENEETLTFSALCKWPQGMIIKVPLGKEKAYSVEYDSSKGIYENKKEYGQNWVYLICPEGKHHINVFFY